MKLFRMAPNSLFAILLRSRWWISFVIGAVWALLALGLLPADYKVVGAIGSVPFFGVGIVALVRQFNAPSPARAAALLETAAAQNWAQFSAALESAWQAEGYRVERVGSASVDFRLERQGKTALVSAKRWKAAHHGMEPLKALQACCEAEGVQDAVYVALQPLQDKAQAHAQTHNMVVLTGADLAGLLAKAGTTAGA